MIKELTTSLFLVQDYCDKTQLLAKGVSYYCGVLYYRLDWLHESIATAVHRPFQQKLLREILLLINTLSLEDVEEYAWNHISLLLRNMLSSSELQVVKAEVHECIHALLPTLTPENRMFFEIQYLGEGEITDEEYETLNKIQTEIQRLNSLKQ